MPRSRIQFKYLSLLVGSLFFVSVIGCGGSDGSRGGVPDNPDAGPGASQDTTNGGNDSAGGGPPSGECVGNVDCPITQQCVNGECEQIDCESTADCRGDYHCNTNVNTCVECTSDSQCAGEGMVCRNNTCEPSEVECRDGQGNPRIGEKCDPNAEPGVGLACLNLGRQTGPDDTGHRCVRIYQSNQSCGGGQVCLPAEDPGQHQKLASDRQGVCLANQCATPFDHQGCSDVGENVFFSNLDQQDITKKCAHVEVQETQANICVPAGQQDVGEYCTNEFCQPGDENCQTCQRGLTCVENVCQPLCQGDNECGASNRTCIGENDAELGLPTAGFCAEQCESYSRGTCSDADKGCTPINNDVGFCRQTGGGGYLSQCSRDTDCQESMNCDLGVCIPTCQAPPAGTNNTTSNDMTCRGHFYARFIYLGDSPGQVDIWVDGRRVADDVGTGEMTDRLRATDIPEFLEIRPGLEETTIAVTAASANSAADPLVETTQTIQSGPAFTWAIGGAQGASLQLQQIETVRELTPPTSTRTKVRVANYVSDFPVPNVQIVGLERNEQGDLPRDGDDNLVWGGAEQVAASVGRGKVGDYNSVPGGNYDLFVFDEGVSSYSTSASLLRLENVTLEESHTLYLHGDWSEGQARSTLIDYIEAPPAPSYKCWNRAGEIEPDPASGYCIDGCSAPEDYDGEGCFQGGLTLPFACTEVEGRHMCVPSSNNYAGWKKPGESCGLTSQFRETVENKQDNPCRNQNCPEPSESNSQCADLQNGSVAKRCCNMRKCRQQCTEDAKNFQECVNQNCRPACAAGPSEEDLPQPNTCSSDSDCPGALTCQDPVVGNKKCGECTTDSDCSGNAVCADNNLCKCQQQNVEKAWNDNFKACFSNGYLSSCPTCPPTEDGQCQGPDGSISNECCQYSRCTSDCSQLESQCQAKCRTKDSQQAIEQCLQSCSQATTKCENNCRNSHPDPAVSVVSGEESCLQQTVTDCIRGTCQRPLSRCPLPQQFGCTGQPGTPSYECCKLSQCIRNCSSADPTCERRCRSKRSLEAQRRYEARLSCFQNQCQLPPLCEEGSSCQNGTCVSSCVGGAGNNPQGGSDNPYLQCGTRTASFNLIPYADAGTDREVVKPANPGGGYNGETVDLNASDSFDIDLEQNESLSYEWQIVGTPSGSQAQLTSTNGQSTTLERIDVLAQEADKGNGPSDLQKPIPGAYIVELTVEDPEGASDTDRVKVTLFSNKFQEANAVYEAPEPELNSAQARNVNLGAKVGFDAQGSVSNISNSQSFNYAWELPHAPETAATDIVTLCDWCSRRGTEWRQSASECPSGQKKRACRATYVQSIQDTQSLSNLRSQPWNQARRFLYPKPEVTGTYTVELTVEDTPEPTQLTYNYALSGQSETVSVQRSALIDDRTVRVNVSSNVAEKSRCTAAEGEFGSCGQSCKPSENFTDTNNCPEGLQNCIPDRLDDEGKPVDAYCAETGDRQQGESCGGEYSFDNPLDQNCEPGTRCAQATGYKGSFTGGLTGMWVHQYQDTTNVCLPYTTAKENPTCRPTCRLFDGNKDCPEGSACIPDIAVTGSSVTGICLKKTDQNLSETITGTPCSRDDVGEACGPHSLCVLAGGSPICYEMCDWNTKKGCSGTTTCEQQFTSNIGLCSEFSL